MVITIGSYDKLAVKTIYHRFIWGAGSDEELIIYSFLVSFNIFVFSAVYYIAVTWLFTAGVGTVQVLVSQATSYDKSVSTWFPYVRSTFVSGRLSSIFNITQAVKHLNNQHGTPYFGI